MNSLFLNLKNNSTVPNEANLMVSSESCVLLVPNRAMSVWLKEAAASGFVANWLYHLLARLGPSEVGVSSCHLLGAGGGGRRQRLRSEEAVGATAAVVLALAA